MVAPVGKGAPPSVQLFPPSVENEKPTTPGGFGGGQAKFDGGPQTPWKSSNPTSRFWPSALAAIVVVLRVGLSLGKSCCGAFTRTSGETWGPPSAASGPAAIVVPQAAISSTATRASLPRFWSFSSDISHLHSSAGRLHSIHERRAGTAR
jgi:hypothetical protein